ncbi:histone-fold-containing protein [Dunaliella salina]|uniref:Histone-fold-containing protein n=1 Tax=Dunaliella salina TaxID=3046 RepID=A0ABQ7G4B9_DUNSA|nr:histone-fold-containing protein [Dunaliella salina]|eukprot:KAF5829419.1 histone-fold-containing protein [Dunaliella salina]
MDGPTDKEEVLLPKATISKLIKDTLSGRDMRMAGDTTEMIVDCCTEFIQLVSSEANEVSTREKKQTIGPEHVLKALKELDFEEFVGDVQSAWDQFKEESKVGHANRANLRRTGADREGLTAEQQIELQQQMFAAARAQTSTSADNAAQMAAAYQQAQMAALRSNSTGREGSGGPAATPITPLEPC